MSDSDWRELYNAAIREVDPALLRKRLELAEQAIYRRLEIMRHLPSLPDELTDIYDALSKLRIEKKEADNWLGAADSSPT